MYIVCLLTCSQTCTNVNSCCWSVKFVHTVIFLIVALEHDMLWYYIIYNIVIASLSKDEVV